MFSSASEGSRRHAVHLLAYVTSARSPLRRTILAAADSAQLQRVAQAHGFRLGAARFVAGESLDEAVKTLARLNERGLLTNTTLLGEGVRDTAQIQAVVADYRELIERIRSEKLRTNVALKLTQLGLALDEQLAYRNVAEPRPVLRRARQLHSH